MEAPPTAVYEGVSPEKQEFMLKAEMEGAALADVMRAMLNVK